MSLPRRILPGSTYMITRRCSQRQFLLAPTEHATQVFLYCLAVAAERTGLLIHAVTQMSNHYHLVATDVFGRAPEFLAWFHEFVAKALNAHYGRWENFWSSEQTSLLELADEAAILDKIAYTLLNPVKAGLVADGEQWPGARLWKPGSYRIKRPPGFFRPNGPLPDEVTLNIVAPPVGGTAKQTVLDRIVELVRIGQAAICEAFKAKGRRFLGRDRVRAQRFYQVPTTEEPRREMSPRVACRNKWRRIEILQRSKEWLASYREARRAFLDKMLDAIFPAGTYQMAMRFRVRVAPA
jgi:putative transposase